VCVSCASQLVGFGHDLARRLDDHGFVVFAGCLHPDKAGAQQLRSGSSRRLHVVPHDVRSDDSTELAHAYVKKHLPAGGDLRDLSFETSNTLLMSAVKPDEMFAKSVKFISICQKMF